MLISAAVLAVILGLALAGSSRTSVQPQRDEVRSAVDLHYSIFCPGVYVDGLSLGGLTAEEGLAAVQSRSLQTHQTQLRFSRPAETSALRMLIFRIRQITRFSPA